MATTASAVQIPVTNTNLEMTGKSTRGYGVSVAPVCETGLTMNSTLRGEYVRDEESLDMLDYIFEHQVFDPAFYMTSFSTESEVAL